MGIAPLYYKMYNQIKENEKLRFQIKEQQELAPVNLILLNASKEKNVFVLPNPEKIALPRSESGKFESDFQMVVKKSGLKIVSFKPDTNTLSNSSKSLLHNVVLNGEWNDLRKLLIELGGLSYLDRIDEITVQQGAGFMEFNMKIRVALK